MEGIQQCKRKENHAGTIQDREMVGGGAQRESPTLPNPSLQILWGIANKGGSFLDGDAKHNCSMLSIQTASNDGLTPTRPNGEQAHFF